MLGPIDRFAQGCLQFVARQAPAAAAAQDSADIQHGRFQPAVRRGPHPKPFRFGRKDAASRARPS